MIKETIYHPNELKRGKCRCCGEMSNEILIGDGRCVECIEEEVFIEEIMNMEPKWL